MRKLASIRKIEAIHPIEGADLIEAVQIGLWRCVAKKGEFQVNDLTVYYEIDSFLPASDERYKFLEKEFRTFEGKEGVKLKTRKMRGQVSQGLALPLSLFPELEGKSEDDDVTEILGIVKWEVSNPAILSGLAKGNFPSFIPKTDEERIQNIWRNYERWIIEDDDWEITEKIDGSSFTGYYQEGNVGICSRNLELKECLDNAFWNTAINLNVVEALKKYGHNIALQGELYGPGIQGNSKKTEKLNIAIFNIWDIDEQRYLTPEERIWVIEDLKSKGMLCGSIRIVKDVVKLSQFPTFESLQQAVDDDKETYEGWVFKRKDGKESFKVISNKYLLKTGG